MRLGLERSVAAISIIAIAWHLIAWNVLHAPAHLSDWPLVAALIIAGAPLTITRRAASSTAISCCAGSRRGGLALIFSPVFRL